MARFRSLLWPALTLGLSLPGDPAHAQDTRKMEFLLGGDRDKFRIVAEYYDPSELDRRLKGSRVLPVLLKVRNISTESLAFNASDVRLNLNGTQPLPPVDSARIAEEVRRGGKVPGLMSFLAGQSTTFHRNEADRRQLRDGRLRPNEEKEGLLYFMRPEAPHDPAFNGVLLLETSLYPPQILDTKDVKVRTRPTERTGFWSRISALWDEHVLGARPPFNRSYALLIGVGKYRYLTPLSSPAVDVTKMSAFLDAQGFDEVVEVTDESVTVPMLRAPQQYFKTKIQPDDRFVFYYSGHGNSVVEGGSMRGYLPLANEQAAGTSNSIPMDSLVAWMGALNTKHLLVILDSCFSGLAVNGPELKDGQLAVDRVKLGELARGPARFLLMAGTAGQKSIGDRRWNGSLFTNAIIQGAEKAERADMIADRILTTRELYIWLKDEVSREALKAGYQLTPLLKDLGPKGVSEGEFVFVRKL